MQELSGVSIVVHRSHMLSHWKHESFGYFISSNMFLSQYSCMSSSSSFSSQKFPSQKYPVFTYLLMDKLPFAFRDRASAICQYRKCCAGSSMFSGFCCVSALEDPFNSCPPSQPPPPPPARHNVTDLSSTLPSSSCTPSISHSTSVIARPHRPSSGQEHLLLTTG